MSDFTSTPIASSGYAPLQAENGKFVVLDSSTISGMPTAFDPNTGAGLPKYAILTYVVNSQVPSAPKMSTATASSVTAVTTATLVLAANTNRAGNVTISNYGTVDAFVGFTSAVAVGQGLYVKASGGVITIPASQWTAAIYAITASSTTLAVLEGSK